MSDCKFVTLLEERWKKGKFACVGLDSELGKIPDCLKMQTSDSTSAVVKFNTEIIKTTAEHVCCFKPNGAFYLGEGTAGMTALDRTFRIAGQLAPSIPLILDLKVGDIGNTNRGYLKLLLEHLCGNAITVNPYVGAHWDPDPTKHDGLQIFLEEKDIGVFVLCRTSNKGATAIQERPVIVGEAEFEHMQALATAVDWKGTAGGYIMPFYQYIALLVDRVWNRHGNCALVVGANHPKQLAAVRELCPKIPILIPAFGKQIQGEENIVKQTVFAGLDASGGGIICNNSRNIIFASGGENYAEAAGEAAKKFNDEISGFVCDWHDAAKQ
ncbi:MAG: orotidine-5'-phosphate decarboxylase [Candidatus Pacebacteria bacterium]|nr:orotidine-5'-phosphate decarboxylase [Candidatus Paceibacterota bacterium]